MQQRDILEFLKNGKTACYLTVAEGLGEPAMNVSTMLQRMAREGSLHVVDHSPLCKESRGRRRAIYAAGPGDNVAYPTQSPEERHASNLVHIRRNNDRIRGDRPKQAERVRDAYGDLVPEFGRNVVLGWKAPC